VEFRRVYGLDRKLFVAHDLQELAAVYRETAAHGLGMLVTELVPGADDAVWTYTACLAAGGRPVLEGVKRKLRQWPPHFGIGSYHATGVDEHVLDAGRRFVRGVGARGLAAVEFKRDARTGNLVLIECNQRFPNGCEVFAAAGLNFPLAIYEQTLGRTTRPQPEPRQDARLLFFVEDFRSFLELRRAGELTTAAWLRSVAHRQRFPVFSVADPVPSLVTNAALVAGVARRLIRRLGHGRAPA
jgi:predicted ATP-grasp superfamily ATP-dependent carboligase